jgi:hypothetical protein
MHLSSLFQIPSNRSLSSKLEPNSEVSSLLTDTILFGGDAATVLPSDVFVRGVAPRQLHLPYADAFQNVSERTPMVVVGPPSTYPVLLRPVTSLPHSVSRALLDRYLSILIIISSIQYVFTSQLSSLGRSVRTSILASSKGVSSNSLHQTTLQMNVELRFSPIFSSRFISKCC